MRIWDISPSNLCRNHLLGEHRELHALWTILIKNKTGYRNHPETKRWIEKLHALYIRHEQLVKEMKKRGYNHNSPLDKKYANGKSTQDYFIHSLEEQKTIIKNKKCDCKIK